jgi:hypothetical protein
MRYFGKHKNPHKKKLHLILPNHLTKHYTGKHENIHSKYGKSAMQVDGTIGVGEIGYSIQNC